MKGYESAYPGSMRVCEDGEFISRNEPENLADALIERIHELERQCEDNTDLRTRCEKAEKDAERYRWIRRGNLYQGPRALWFDFSLGRWEHTEGEALDKYTDEAIDAAIAKERT